MTAHFPQLSITAVPGGVLLPSVGAIRKALNYYASNYSARINGETINAETRLTIKDLYEFFEAKTDDFSITSKTNNHHPVPSLRQYGKPVYHSISVQQTTGQYLLHIYQPTADILPDVSVAKEMKATIGFCACRISLTRPTQQNDKTCFARFPIGDFEEIWAALNKDRLTPDILKQCIAQSIDTGFKLKDRAPPCIKLLNNPYRITLNFPHSLYSISKSVKNLSDDALTWPVGAVDAADTQNATIHLDVKSPDGIVFDKKIIREITDGGQMLYEKLLESFSPSPSPNTQYMNKKNKPAEMAL